MKAERMKYTHDQREWVRVADAQLPAMRQRASDLQKVAADWFRVKEIAPFVGVQDFISEAYAEAMTALFRVLYYEAMRRANLPETE